MFYFGVQKNVAANWLVSQYAKNKNKFVQCKINAAYAKGSVMREKADSDLVRRQNRRLVLDALRQHGPLARIELGRHTGLSPASITSISSQLISDGIVQ